MSGHSTFSRAAAETLTLVTGTPYFPGGLGIFDAIQNEFLVFEEGPSETIELQWATYRDASDQCSLSRIWGGIHPPIDDVRGRLIGRKIGIESYNLALDYFNGTLSNTAVNESNSTVNIYPVPFNDILNINSDYNGQLDINIYTIDGKEVYKQHLNKQTTTIAINTNSLSTGLYFLKLVNENDAVITIKKVIKN